MKYYPSALNVQGRQCLVVGDDHEAIDKAQRLAHAGAHVQIIGENLPAADRARLSKHKIQVEVRKFFLGDIRDQFFVLFCPKDDRELTRRVWELCQERRILLCALDQPDFCDVVNVSVFDRGPLRIMISTDGISPALSKRIRTGLEKSLKDVPLESFLEDLRKLRSRLERSISDLPQRRQALIEAVKDVEFRVSMTLPKRPIKAPLRKINKND